jgi:putative ABC transport system permease protein
MLRKKMLRDMKHHKIQFISIFLMSFLSVFIYSGISSEWNGMKTEAQVYYDKTNLAQVWLYGKGFSEEALQAVKAVEGVTGAERRLTLEAAADYENDPVLTLHIAEVGKISSCHVMEGEAFSTEEDGIWLDYDFAQAKKLKVGDSIGFTVNGLTFRKIIKGLVLNPEYVYAPPEGELLPNHNNYGFAYLSVKAWPEGLPLMYSELLITTDKEVDSAFEEEIDKALNGKYSVILTREQKVSFHQLNTEIEEHKAMGSIFPLAFLAVALLTIMTTMIRLVNNQRTQIGVLKALGFSRRRILFHYVSFGLWLSLAGAILGVIIGPVTLPYLFYGAMKMMFSLPAWGPKITLSSLWMALITVAGCTLVTFLACHNNLKDTPAQSLRPKSPRKVRHTGIEKSALWRRLGFNTQWNLRDALRSKIRSLMAIVGVLGCTALLLCAFGMRDSLKEFTEWNFHDINTYETEISLAETITKEQIDSLKETYHAEAVEEAVIEVKANGVKKSGELMVMDQVTLIQSFDADRNPISLPEQGIAISKLLAEQLKVTPGDTIEWHIYGEEGWHSSKIGGIIRKPISQGLTMTRESFEELGYTFRPTTLYTLDRVPEDLKADDRGVARVWSKEELKEDFQAMIEAMNLLIYILMLAAVVLAVVVLYNLGVLSFQEKQRELSTLKVIGFHSGRIRTLLLTQNIWMTALGTLLGIPVGLWIIEYIFRFMGESFDFITVVYPLSYLYSILGTFLVSIMVNRLFSRKVKSLDMVSSLKGVE